VVEDKTDAAVVSAVTFLELDNRTRLNEVNLGPASNRHRLRTTRSLSPGIWRNTCARTVPKVSRSLAKMVVADVEVRPEKAINS
jgi:hypothetical protein